MVVLRGGSEKDNAKAERGRGRAKSARGMQVVRSSLDSLLSLARAVRAHRARWCDVGVIVGGGRERKKVGRRTRTSQSR